MGKLYFHYSTMNAGKSTALLQANHNYIERGMKTHLLTAKLDDREGCGGQIHSRIGITQPAEVFEGGTDLFALLAALAAREEIACVFVDEAQFLSKAQVCRLTHGCERSMRVQSLSTRWGGRGADACSATIRPLNRSGSSRVRWMTSVCQ